MRDKGRTRSRLSESRWLLGGGVGCFVWEGTHSFPQLQLSIESLVVNALRTRWRIDV